MSISPYIPGFFNIDAGSATLGTTRLQLDDLQRQLSSGKKSDTYGGLGVQRYTALDVRAKIDVATAYQDTIQRGQVRINLLSSGLDQVYKDVTSSQTELTGQSYLVGADGYVIGQRGASTRFSSTIDVLNGDQDGEYLYGGRTTDTAPTVDAKTIIEGDGVKAGVRQLIAEHKLADLGTGNGRLTQTNTAGGATIQDETATQSVFGFKVVNPPSGSFTNATITGPAAGSLDVSFTGQPAPGESLIVHLTLPDGTLSDVTLRARAYQSGIQNDTFEIGPTLAQTVSNFQAALTSGLAKAAGSDLAAYSALKGSADFFSGTATSPPPRIAGPPFATATGFQTTAVAAATTVNWYTGDIDPAVAPRTAQGLRIDTNTVVGVGVRANEQAFQTALASWATLSVETFSTLVPNDQLRWTALASRARLNFSQQPGVQQIKDISIDIGLANNAAKAASSKHRARAQFLGSISDEIENAKPEDIAVIVNALQTRLEASYSVTSKVGQLSLVNFLK